MRVEAIDGALSRELRRRVLRPSQGPEAFLPGDDRDDALHVAALAADGTVLGACMVFEEPCGWRDERPAWMLRSMATSPEARRLGIGLAVADAARDAAAGAGAAILWCHAREAAADFWHAAGWFDRYPDGDSRQVYLDQKVNLLHRDMWLPLT